jgi:hypothetical protein
MFTKTKEYLPAIPADKFIASLVFRSEKLGSLYQPFITLTMKNYLRQEKIYDYELPNDSYSLFDFHIGGSFKAGKQSFDITVSINNILDASYTNHLSPFKYLLPVPVREMGRNVSVQFHVPFGIKNK